MTVRLATGAASQSPAGSSEGLLRGASLVVRMAAAVDEPRCALCNSSRDPLDDESPIRMSRNSNKTHSFCIYCERAHRNAKGHLKMVETLNDAEALREHQKNVAALLETMERGGKRQRVVKEKAQAGTRESLKYFAPNDEWLPLEEYYKRYNTSKLLGGHKISTNPCGQKGVIVPASKNAPWQVRREYEEFAQTSRQVTGDADEVEAEYERTTQGMRDVHKSLAVGPDADFMANLMKSVAEEVGRHAPPPQPSSAATGSASTEPTRRKAFFALHDASAATKKKPKVSNHKGRDGASPPAGPSEGGEDPKPTPAHPMQSASNNGEKHRRKKVGRPGNKSAHSSTVTL